MVQPGVLEEDKDQDRQIGEEDDGSKEGISDQEDLSQDAVPEGQEEQEVVPKPLSKGEQIKLMISEGYSKEDIVELGYNANSVRTIWSEMKSAGQLPKVSVEKEEVAMAVPAESPKVPARKGQRDGDIAVFAKGSPPEALINAVRIPSSPDGLAFEQGVKTGMSLIVLGVRISQELSSLGAAQVRPILDMV